MKRSEVIEGLRYIKNWECHGDTEMYGVVVSAIEMLEQFDIVHCGECIYWHNDGCLHPVFGCHDANYDEFCSAGKRKEMKCDD